MSSEKEVIRQRDKILRIADKRGWGIVKDDSDIAETVKMPPDVVLPFQKSKTKSGNLRTKDRVFKELRGCSTAYPPNSFFLGVQNSTVVRSSCRDSTSLTTENPYKHRTHKIPYTYPESVFLSNKKSALQSAPFLEKAITEL